MIVSIIKRIKESRDSEKDKKIKAGLQQALIIVLEIDRENDLAKLEELQSKLKNKS